MCVILAEEQQESGCGRSHADDVLHEDHRVREPYGRGKIVENVPEPVSDRLRRVDGPSVATLAVVCVIVVAAVVIVARQPFVLAAAAAADDDVFRPPVMLRQCVGGRRDDHFCR